jgi:hypothetical protein
MSIQDATTSSESGRRALDRHVVTAAGQLLMSAISLEHRVRRFSTQLKGLPSPRASVVSLVRSSASQPSERGLDIPNPWGD